MFHLISVPRSTLRKSTWYAAKRSDHCIARVTRIDSQENSIAQSRLPAKSVLTRMFAQFKQA